MFLSGLFLGLGVGLMVFAFCKTASRNDLERR